MLRDQHIVQWSTKEKRTLGPGVLGLVFPQDIFKEYEDDCAEGPDLQLPAASTDSSTGANQVLLGAQILSHLQKISWFREIIEIKNKIFPGWILGPILARSLFHCLGEMYDHAMRSSQDTNASLASLSRQIFTNTSQDIQVHPGMNPAEYFNLTAARWDTIGLGFALLGTALSLIPDDDPIFTHRNPWKLQRSQLRESAIAMSEICCQFCNNAGTASDPWCWLMIQQTGLLSSAFGDSGNYFSILSTARVKRC